MTHKSRCHTWPAFNGDGPRSLGLKLKFFSLSGCPCGQDVLHTSWRWKKPIRPPGTNIHPYSDLPWRGISPETQGKTPESHFNIGYFHKKCRKYIDFTGSGSGWKFFELIWFTTPNSKILLFLDFLGQYPMDPGEILRGHHISNFGKEITRDNRLEGK